MDKHAKKTSLPHYPVLIVFALFFVGLFALDLITPDRAYSEMENTTLSQRPALTQLSAKGLNSYFTAYTKYVKDQVFGRDQWISLQSMVETTLLQKEQNGGILLGREHMMFARHYSILKNEEKGMAKNLAAVQSLVHHLRRFKVGFARCRHRFKQRKIPSCRSSSQRRYAVPVSPVRIRPLLNQVFCRRFVSGFHRHHQRQAPGFVGRVDFGCTVPIGRQRFRLAAPRQHQPRRPAGRNNCQHAAHRQNLTLHKCLPLLKQPVR